MEYSGEPTPENGGGNAQRPSPNGTVGGEGGFDYPLAPPPSPDLGLDTPTTTTRPPPTASDPLPNPTGPVEVAPIQIRRSLRVSFSLGKLNASATPTSPALVGLPSAAPVTPCAATAAPIPSPPQPPTGTALAVLQLAAPSTTSCDSSNMDVPPLRKRMCALPISILSDVPMTAS